jgi:uncharacterized membrane protein YgcG
MRCPACQQHLREGDAACPACGLTLASLDAHLGIPPQLTAPVADMADVLTFSARRTIAQSVRVLEQRFPDLRGVVVTAAVPANFTPELYSFWIFNRTGLFSAVEKGGDNHGVMLLFDTQAPRCVVTIGYGLEPLLPNSALEPALSAATSYLPKRNYGSAGAAFFRELERQLDRVSRSWPQTFGYSESEAWFESSTGTLVRADDAAGEDPY